MTETNPNKINQYTDEDPRQRLCWEYYINPESESFSNAMKSGVRAGYTEQYAGNIPGVDWFKERKAKFLRSRMFEKAEKKLDKILDYDPESAGGGKVDVSLLKVQADVAKTIVTTIGKVHYSTRSEVTGPDGKELPAPILSAIIKKEE